MSQPTFSVEQILETPFPSYHLPLALARSLNRSGDRAKRTKALTLLEGLSLRYPHALAVGQEFVLALIECGEHDRSELALRALEITFANLDEEILCRWGRLFKDRGDDYLELPGAVSNRFAPNRDRAAEFYRKALEKYDQAYRNPSDHYPGINKATMLLIVGSLKAEGTGQAPGSSPPRELLESVELAGKLLEHRGSWKTEQSDDKPVWHPATQGEAHLLRREWAQAADLYREALGAREINHLARESMHRQVDRILLAFRNLGIAIPPPFDDAAAFFAPGSAPPHGKNGAAANAAGPSPPGPEPISRAGQGVPSNADVSPRESGSG
jgi:tetratricopeptide (TPR) repeat protein